MPDRTCSVSGCEKSSHRRGMCNMHYTRMQRHGTTEDPRLRRPPPAACGVDECVRQAKVRGYCLKHYERLRKWGDPLHTKLNREHDGTCSVEGCTGAYAAVGLCGMHYQRFLNTGSVDLVPRVSPVCSEPGCGLTARGRGLCSKHYQRFMIHGTTEARPHWWKSVKKGHCVVCGAQARRLLRRRDLCTEHYLVWAKSEAVSGRWVIGTNPLGYQYVVIDAKNYLLHRLVMEHVVGRELFPSENVHHLNGVRGDNRPENLELWVKPQPAGQRVEDLVAWVVSAYPEYVAAALNNEMQLRLIT